MSKIHAKIRSVKTKIVGKQVYGTGGAIGRQIEDMLQSEGWPIQRGAGADVKAWGIEIKSRRLGAKSRQTVGKMSAVDIIDTPYDASLIKQKLQKQIRVYWKGELENKDTKTPDNSMFFELFDKDRDNNPEDIYTGKIASVEIYDFSPEHIQDIFRRDYEHGRAEIASGNEDDWIKGRPNCYANFELDRAGCSWQYEFRITEKCYRKLENMAKAKYTKIFKVTE